MSSQLGQIIDLLERALADRSTRVTSFELLEDLLEDADLGDPQVDEILEDLQYTLAEYEQDPLLRDPSDGLLSDDDIEPALADALAKLRARAIG